LSRRGGWRRHGAKRFRYEDARGTAITDPAKLARIEGLVIPPAWKEVWISPNAGAKLQATGIDAAGRQQYIYHPDVRAAQEQAKYDSLVRFGELLPGLRAAVGAHVLLDPLSVEWTLAHAVTLINRSWFRVGSETYARGSRTYGVSTLLKRHVEARGSRLRFTFRGKHRTLVRATLVDPELAGAIKELLQLPGGSRVFRFEDESGRHNVTAPLLNDYLSEHLGGGFTAKDFRTWGGSLTAAVALAEHGPPTSETDATRAVAAAMRRVATELGNTPAVARASYVSPAVIEQFRDGRTLDHFRDRGHRRLSARSQSLEPEEQSLLSLLRSWRIRQARAAD
jgi:DNA topoisomerase-1